MKRAIEKRRMTRLSAAAVFSLLAGSACSMTINPNGTGQVLIFPYYTVNQSQQTLLTVSNPTTAAKSLEVVFHEAYNGKVVYSIDVQLAPHQTWTTAAFALSDINVTGHGVGISDNVDVCSTEIVSTPSGVFTPGLTYSVFSNEFFTGTNADAGPTDDSRTREGFIEVFELSEIQGATATSLSNGTCPTLSQPVATDYTAPTGGIAGSVAVINVPQGTFFAFEPKAIDGFRAQAILPLHDATLAMAGDETSDTVSASIPYHGTIVTTTFPNGEGIDAVSNLFMAQAVYGDIDETQAIGANTDWVLTFPTKQFYVNAPQMVGLGPFDYLVGDAQSPFGGSYVPTPIVISAHNGALLNACGFSGCPLGPPWVVNQTQIVSFAPPFSGTAPSAVLGSSVVTPAPSYYSAESGALLFNGFSNASNENIVLSGAPVFGVQAINYVNSNVNAGVLSNYSGTARLHTTVSCTTVNGADCQ